ncbi:LytTR family transcriptional regulator [Muricauda sp. 2012CJ35-5]|uniref:LytTR family transcriptional regulator n=1 Tax=Flagellimonas spongiicola TaxID=2942208 RepID=A0ABT0PM13_9FLAO|nr:LytTR family DNA-binding domain-containing protein [Allomuricauda spongiicola]MCL6272403.1 LytTR family transcriptional regulator [Allomuricauda spongiicola]
MMKLLKTPHPVGFGWAYVLIPASVVFFILVFLAPYGFDELNWIDRIVLAFPFTLITALAAPLNLFLAKLITPRYIDEEKWTLGHEFIYNIYDFALIGFWNTLFLKFTFRTEEPFLPLLIRIEWHTFLVGLIPLIALIAYKHQRAMHRQLLLSERITEELQSKLNATHEENEFALHSETGNFEIKLNPKDIIALGSDGNYAELYYSVHDQTKKHLIRNRLKVLLEQIPSKDFIQCHKSFIVNLKHVTRADGNARDLKLILTNGMAVPVSRAKSKTLLQQLNA